VEFTKGKDLSNVMEGEDGRASTGVNGETLLLRSLIQIYFPELV
jgi:hypothetical protein